MTTSSVENPLITWVNQPANLTLPDFSQITPEVLRETLTAVLDDFRTRLEAITSATEPASFANTVVALEEAIEPVGRLGSVAGVIQSSAVNDDNRPVLSDIFAELSATYLGLGLNADLFARLEAIDAAGLSELDQRHLTLLIDDFAREGARLDAEQKKRVEEISAELTRLENEFANILQQESVDSAFVITKDGEYSPDGLSESQLAGAAAEAEERDIDGWVLPLESTTVQPPAEALSDPGTRSALLAVSTARGSRGNDNDTRGNVTQITALRAQLAEILGFETFADYAISSQQAGTPEAASGLLTSMVEPANAQLGREIQLIKDTASPDRLAPEDLPYWLRRVGEEQFGIDRDEVSKYFEFNRVLHDGVFYAAHHLYGLDFENVTERFAGTLWDETVEVYEATENGEVLGLITVDPYSRVSKRGGAWMSEFVMAAHLTGEKPIITMTMNIPKPAPGTPALLSLDDVNTLFHEFGHVWHGMFADSPYPSRAGTSVPRDYVEFPSQLNEMWMFHPQVLPNYAKHVDTGEVLPEDIVDKIKKAQQFGQGFGTIEYLAAALLDLAWHDLKPGESIEDVLEFESSMLSDAGFSNMVLPRYRTPYFQHSFSFGYSAGYYSYLWSEQLAAYVDEWFNAQGGLDRESGDAFRRAILAPGFSVDPKQAIQEFFGEQPTVDPLLRRLGLAKTE